MIFFKKINLIIFTFFILGTTELFAKSFSLQIIQKSNSENVTFNASYLVEQSIMDYFFDNNYIVSNSPIIVAKKNQNLKAELQQSFDDAQNGFLDYLIEVSIFYDLSESNNPEEALLSNVEKIEWRIILVQNRNEISSGKVIPKNYKNDDSGLISFSSEIAKYLKKEIETKGGQK